jgi:hypothetical protein
MPDRKYVNHMYEIKITRKPNQYVGFEVLIAVVKKNFVFWDVTPCSPLFGLKMEETALYPTRWNPSITVLL